MCAAAAGAEGLQAPYLAACQLVFKLLAVPLHLPQPERQELQQQHTVRFKHGSLDISERNTVTASQVNHLTLTAYDNNRNICSTLLKQPNLISALLYCKRV